MKEYFIRVLNKVENSVLEYEVSFLLKKDSWEASLGELRNLEVYPKKSLESKLELEIHEDYKISIEVEEGKLKIIIKAEKIDSYEGFLFMSDFLTDEYIESTFSFFNRTIMHSCNIEDVRVYNVEQGNMNSIHFYNSEVILFDQGSKNKKSLNGKVPENFDYSNVTTIIVSHLHEDHYNLLKASNFNNIKYFLFPNDVMVTDFADIVEQFKKTYSKIRFVPIHLSNTKGTIINHAYFCGINFFSGNIAGGVNNRGIILNMRLYDRNYNHYHGSIKSFTGDIEWDLYTQTLIYQNYSELSIVVPHHGGNIGKASSSIPAPFRSLNAVYSCDDGTSYGHPLSKTIDKIKKCKFNQLFTKHIALYDYYRL